MVSERLLELLRRLQHILLRQHPRAPVHAQRLFALGIPEDLDRVPRVGVHGAHDPPRHVRADGDEAEGEGAAQPADVGEGGTMGQMRVRLGPVVLAVGAAWDGAVARVAGEVY